MPHICFSSYSAGAGAKLMSLAAATIVLTSCAGGPPTHFAGTIRPIAGTCDPPGRAILTSTGAHVQFVPQDGVVILSGTLSQTGEIGAALAVRAADHTPAALHFSGQMHGARITGSYTTPRCRYAVELSATD